MRIHLPYIAIILLLITVYILDKKNDRLEKENSLKSQHELQLKLDSTRSELSRSILVRSKLTAISDSLLHTSASLKIELERVKKPNPHQYDKLTNKELQDKMIDRWQQKRGN